MKNIDWILKKTKYLEIMERMLIKNSLIVFQVNIRLFKTNTKTIVIMIN
jgi:hypothetical protein